MKKALAGCSIVLILVFSGGCHRTARTGAVHSAESGAKKAPAAEEVVLIDDIAGWNHATKAVFEDYGFEITRAELRSAKDYLVFYVNPSDHGTRVDNYEFLTAVARKNDFSDYEIVSLGGHFAEVRCNKKTQRVTWVKAGLMAKYYGDSEEEAQKKALESIVKELRLTYDEETQAYGQEGTPDKVILTPLGFDEDGRYVIWVCPDDDRVSPLNICYVDISDGTVIVE